jgi:peptidoglycan hydrolase CwlO-like protein
MNQLPVHIDESSHQINESTHEVDKLSHEVDKLSGEIDESHSHHCKSAEFIFKKKSASPKETLFQLSFSNKMTSENF